MLLTNADLYAPEPLGRGSVLVEGSQIVEILGPDADLPGGPVVDLAGVALGPGLIDVHTHGADGANVMDGGDAVQRMSRFFARHGVTGFVPSTVTASLDAVANAVAGIRQAMSSPVQGARVFGVHLEGPFISPDRLGAQSPDYCVLPTRERLERVLEIAGDVTEIVTLAPEVEGALEATRLLAARGIVVSIGHTVATAEQAEEAFRAGATQATHLFNGMGPLHHREPGAVGAALVDPGVRVEVIADGLHLHPTTVRLIVQAKGPDRVLLVTDSMAATGCADGEYELGPVKVYVRNGEARLASGALASSTLTMERAVRNVAGWTGVGLGEAWHMASLAPARQLGLDDRVGRLAVGYDADLVALDHTGQVVLTVVRGEIVHRKPS
jgi:N-acetylglucosamine-6-phosphate deacetylase